LKEIQKQLLDRGKIARITCSTGIGVYENACTINRFLGLYDGRFQADEIKKIHVENSKFNYVKDNLKNIDCLIVDECSMISLKTFETILMVCSTKETSLQLIFCGDFFQLPPVANIRYHDDGKYCFVSPKFAEVFPHRVVLRDNIRTRENTLIKSVNDIFNGNVTPEVESFLHHLNRPLHKNENSVKLFSINQHVDDYNRNCILKHPGEIYEFVSKDSGDKSELFQIKAPHTLWLKIGCPVILLQNLSDKLVNGLRGIVHSFDEDGPVINFNTLGLVTKVPKVKFTGNKVILLILNISLLHKINVYVG
jgi:ATP-dependent DNA helicase PIF1